MDFHKNLDNSVGMGSAGMGSVMKVDSDISGIGDFQALVSNFHHCFDTLLVAGIVPNTPMY